MDWVLRVMGWLWAVVGAWNFWLQPTPSSFLDGMLMFVLPGIALAGLGSLLGAVRSAIPKVPAAEVSKPEVVAE